MSKDGDFSEVGYILGVMSIILAFFQPVAAFITGIVGFVHSRKQKTHLSEKAKKLNIIGIVLSIIFFAITAALAAWLATKGFNNLPI